MLQTPQLLSCCFFHFSLQLQNRSLRLVSALSFPIWLPVPKNFLHYSKGSLWDMSTNDHHIDIPNFSKITADGDCSHDIKGHLLLGRKAMTNLDSALKSRDITLLTKVPIVKVTVFPAVMYGCESQTIKKAEHQRIDDFELWCWRRLLRVNSKGSQSWIFIGRTDAEAEATILWSPGMKSRLISKDPDAGKDRRQKEKRMTEDEMVWWHHRPSGHEFKQVPRDGKRQGSLVCCSPWGH